VKPLERALRGVNRNMAVFDFVLGSGALFAPRETLWFLGHDRPSPDAEQLVRRCGPIWLTFAAAHTVAALRGDARDWWALAWLRGTEIATDAVWSRSAAFRRPGARLVLQGAGLGNLAMTIGFSLLAADRRRRELQPPRPATSSPPPPPASRRPDPPSPAR
jgi:hypothetical protein